MQPEQPVTPAPTPEQPQPEQAPQPVTAPTPAPVSQAPIVQPSEPAPFDVPAATVPPTSTSQPVSVTPAEAPQDPQPPAPGEAAIQWQAPEYIQHQRSPLWFVGFWAVVLLMMGFAAFVIQSWSFALLIPAMAAALMIYSHRPPRMLGYVLSNKGLYINDKLHPMEEFRSFGVLQEESLPELVLIPVKRFRPALTIHFPDDIGEAVVDLLGSRIPMKDASLDAFDQIVRRLRM